MDGRLWTVLLTLLVPAVLIGLTVAFFSLNPLSMLVLFAVMVAGILYLLTYTETF